MTHTNSAYKPVESEVYIYMWLYNEHYTLNTHTVHTLYNKH